MADHYTVKNDSGFKDSLVEFSQNTTFHGLRYIGSPGSKIRRLMWLLFVLACLTAVILQIVDRVQYYYSWPLNVNVKINYNQSLKFPAVTICNQNAFRATEAAEHGYYRLMEEMFGNPHFNSTESLGKYNATNVTIEQMYTTLAHSKYDFIVKCAWNKKDCTADDFDLILTDHGVCFIFKRPEGEMFVSASGVDAGLRLTLNVEQYEYMTGPHAAAGIKILLHEPLEMPFVHELGQAVPTGAHAFVGVKLMTIENLPLPYGECDHKKLPHTDFYTSEECYADCLVGLADERCSCRDMYMPTANDEPPVCTLQKQYTCLESLKEDFETSLREHCKCPVPCAFSLFDPSISYATISNHVVNKLLTSSATSKLKQKLLNASEVSAKYEVKKLQKFQHITDELRNTFSKLKYVINEIASSLEQHKNITEELTAEIWNVYQEKDRLYRFQEYAVEKNFMRGREAMEERTLRNVPNAYAEFAMIAKRRIERLAVLEPDKEDEREQLYNLIIDALTVRQDIIRMARANITLLLDSYINGTKIFNYKFESVSRAHNPHIVPKPLLNDSMHHNWYMRKYVPKIKTDDFDLFDYVLDYFKNLTTIAFNERYVNATELNWVYERFQYTCRTFMFSKSVVYTQGIDRPIQILGERRLDFENIWNNFNSQITVLNQSMLSLKASIDNLNAKAIPMFEDILLKTDMYFKETDISLMTLVHMLASNTTMEYQREIDNFFQEIQTRGQAMNDAWSLTSKPVRDLWDKVINDEDMLDYYAYTNNSRYQQNIDDVMYVWNQNVTEVQESDIRSLVNFADVNFAEAYVAVLRHLEGYRDSIKIDGDFVKENFLRVDVFFRQLSYEQIRQQKAYDIFALICDIGGAMGLFIGASMLTIVEVIDLFLTQTPIFNKSKRYGF